MDMGIVNADLEGLRKTTIERAGEDVATAVRITERLEIWRKTEKRWVSRQRKEEGMAQRYG
jgi:hypothetical protein